MADGGEDNDEDDLHFSIQTNNSSGENSPISLATTENSYYQENRVSANDLRRYPRVAYPRGELVHSMLTFDPESTVPQSGFRSHPKHASLEVDAASWLSSRAGHLPNEQLSYTSRPVSCPGSTEVRLSTEENSPKGSPEQKYEEFVPDTPLKPFRAVFRSRTYGPEDVDCSSSQGRLASFYVYGWNVPFMHKSVLAKVGFYYEGIRDEVICSKCGGSLSQWEPGDNPWVEHRKHFGYDCFSQN